jgi:L-asparaginase
MSGTDVARRSPLTRCWTAVISLKASCVAAESTVPLPYLLCAIEYSAAARCQGRAAPSARRTRGTRPATGHGSLCGVCPPNKSYLVSVLVLATGGTIAASVEEGVLHLLPIAEICQDLPPELPSWTAIDLQSVASSALGPQDMLGIARQVSHALHDGVEGVVVTHGTDTLEETAFLTDLLLGDDSELGGVVFTGAMRFASHDSPDGPGNLADAIRLTACPAAKGLGVLVSFAGDVFSAHSVMKATTSTLQPFSSRRGPIGRISGNQIELEIAPVPRWPSGQNAVTDVALVKAYPGMSGAGLEALIGEGVRGVVIEGFGVLNVPETLVATLRSAIEQGVAVVIGSRALTSGGLDQGPLGHRRLHELGAVGSYGLSPDQAWVALMVALARTDGSAEELRRWFQSITQ